MTEDIKLYYGNKLESGAKVAGKTPFIGFNTVGQLIYNDGTSSTILVGRFIPSETLQTPVDPTKTYMKLFNTPPPDEEIGPAKIGIRIYRNGLMYYEKYKFISKAAYSAKSDFILVTRTADDDNWVIKKDNVDFLSANDPLTETITENKIAIVDTSTSSSTFLPTSSSRPTSSSTFLPTSSSRPTSSSTFV